MRPREFAFAAGLFALVTTPSTLAAAPVEFVAFGDIPYSQDQMDGLAFMKDRIQEGNFGFVVHYGDMKAGNEPCHTALVEARRDAIYGLAEGRVFYTPGDNDWTDCDRSKKEVFDELERLEALRELFFKDERVPNNEAWSVVRQAPEFPENARWKYNGLQFATLHIVGTHNGRKEIYHSYWKTALEQVTARDNANIVWLEAAFEDAGRDDAAAIVVFIHADPADEVDIVTAGRPCEDLQQDSCNPYFAFLDRLTELAGSFDKPVLLVHGSTSRFCLDTGFGGWRAEKLWRLNGPGDFVTTDAAVIRFDAEALAPFEVRGLMSGDFVADCDRP